MVNKMRYFTLTCCLFLLILLPVSALAVQKNYDGGTGTQIINAPFNFYDNETITAGDDKPI
ncbi:MAG: hypothetical protein LBK46_01150, partial [Oscillospiraceae bacterium]|nr:hypothetical protein [Oscillospiraceae bacterium]